jgi:hypothetical protein
LSGNANTKAIAKRSARVLAVVAALRVVVAALRVVLTVRRLAFVHVRLLVCHSPSTTRFARRDG